MLSDYCKDCKHVAWMLAIGQGIRCQHPQHEIADKSVLPSKMYAMPLISKIENCQLKELHSGKNTLTKT